MYHYHDKRSLSRLDGGSSIGGLSHISIDKEDHSYSYSAMDMDGAGDLKQRLDELEQITMSFLAERPLELTQSSDCFADIDPNNTQEFEMFISEFSHHDVMCLDVMCIPDSSSESDIRPSRIYANKMDHEPLVATLRPKSVDINNPGNTSFRDNTNASGYTTPYQPSYFNGEYEFAITAAHGISPGGYILSVTNTGTHTQSVRVHLSIRPYVNAMPVQNGETVIKRDVRCEFTYFRYVLKEPSHMISIRVKPLGDTGSANCDPDLYVSNKYSGLVCVDTETYLWRSTKIGEDQIDIHPTRDILSGRGSVYIIGVMGGKEKTTDFSLTVSSCAPENLIVCSLDRSPTEITVWRDKYQYFALPVDASKQGKIIMKLTPIGSCEGEPIETESEPEIEQQFGRGVYTEDTLVSTGLFASSDSLSEGGITMAQAISNQLSDIPEKSSETCDLTIRSVPASVSKDTGVFPVVLLSSSCMFPTVNTATWRASALSGNTTVYIETDEWKYSDSGMCYFSIIGVTPPGLCSHPQLSIQCTLTFEERLDDEELDDEMKYRYQLYKEIFAGIDGNNISQRERSKISSGDIQALTYGEIELPAFTKLLDAAGARDGHLFVDLGGGVGKTLVAAAFSGIKFLRCIGVEILPGLCEAARTVIQNTKDIVNMASKKGSETPRSNTYIASLAPNFPLLEIWEGDASDDTSLGMTGWTDADIVYVSSICFPDPLLQKLATLGRALKPGSKFITLKLPENYSQHYDITHQGWYKMSWGRVLVYVLTRNTVAA
mmetsp:Transcript_15109/g.22727  ORF Transcript_15109/g.22727 Transcript_15109/m.22727 type:complete len:774 (-) Transcript_15109:140-2461(-)